MSVQIDIDALTFGGDGIGRNQGKAVFVPLSAPGDRLRCRIVQEKKKHAVAEIAEVVHPSPLRRQPPCPVFGMCGGCQWQHLPYEQQSRWKEKIFSDILSRQAGVAGDSILPMIQAPDEWHYRSRMQFKCRMTDAGFVMGFYKRGTHFVIDVDRCPIAATPLNGALERFRQWIPESPHPAFVPQVDLSLDDRGQVRAVVHLLQRAGVSEGMAAFLKPRAEEAGLDLFLQAGRKETLRRICGGSDLFIQVDDPPLSLGYGPGGFAQVNLSQNRLLVQSVLDAAQGTGAERVLDLFCGMGNFSLPLARRTREVVGVEDFAPSIQSAKINARRNGMTNARFYAGSAEKALETYGNEGSFDLVILDPPRAGAWQVTKELARKRPPKIIYISCDPPTLARDSRLLLHNGYALLWSRPIDLFPQTYHTESISLFSVG